MAQAREPYSDTRDLIEECLADLARRRAKWQGDDLQAIALLASLVEATEQALAAPVTVARQNGHSWAEIAQTLGTTTTELRLQFE